MSLRPRVGISACLLGEAVRHDAGHKRDDQLLVALESRVEWVPVCPEVEVGMGIPREPIRLVAADTGVQSGSRLRLRGVTSGEDWTDRMNGWARDRVREVAAERLSGFVLKSSSPSCGPQAVRVVHPDLTETADGRGLFALALIQAIPDLPVEEETRLHDPVVREAFLRRVAEYQSGHGTTPRVSAPSPNMALRTFDVLRVRERETKRVTDVVVAEEPLEIRLHGQPFATIMRTPGADRALAAGFLLSERVINGLDDLGTIRHCADADGGELQNVLNVTLLGAAAERVPQLLDTRRAVVSNSSCGICGRRSIDDVLRGVRPMPMDWQMRGEVIQTLPERLRSIQVVFDETGGLHGAGLFDPSGALLHQAEDVGRHNAVDKVIGSCLLQDTLPLHRSVLFVSGRTSFEIVQKAIVGGIPMVASVSAPSSLAIDLALSAGVTLVGFVRGSSFNVYAVSERIEL